MLFQGAVANSVPASRQTGNPNALQLFLGELGVSEVLPRYAALAYSGQLFTARAALQATTVVGTAMVGLQLTNNSANKNLVVIAVGGNIVATSATQTGVALAFGTGQTAAPTGQTAASRSGNNFIGGSASVGLATNAATFVNAPVAAIDLLHNTAAIGTTGEDSGYFLDVGGMYVIPPGSYAAFCALGATGAASSNNHWIVWAELPA
jgi:hypothetical protein